MGKSRFLAWFGVDNFIACASYPSINYPQNSKLINVTNKIFTFLDHLIRRLAPISLYNPPLDYPLIDK